MSKLWICSALWFLAGSAAAVSAQPLKLYAKYKLPASIQGRFDHLAVDASGNRLFLAAESAHQVLVFDLHSGAYQRSISGIEIPHAIYVSRHLNRIYVTDGGSGQMKVYSGETYRLLKSIQLKGDSDSIGYDPVSTNLYVDNGGGDAHQPFSLLSIIYTTTDSKVGRYPHRW